MSLDVETLRSSFDMIASRCPRITPRFYEILFSRYPEVRPLFSRNAPERQQEMLQQALVAVLDKLEDAPWLTQTLRAMGAKHVGYGVTDSMYPMVAESLLATLAEILGDDCSPQIERAWRDALDAIAGLMIEGARAERGELAAE